MFLLLRQATIIDPSSTHHLLQKDILIQSGTIIKIEDQIKAQEAEIIDVPGLHISPGWIDIGMQISDPGFEHREDIESATKAAALGGYTAIAPFPNTDPVIHSKAALNYWRNHSRENLVKLLPIGAITHNCNGKDITEMIDMHRAGAIAFSDGSVSTQDNGMMMRALQYVRAFAGLVINRPYDHALAGGGHLHEGYTSTTLGIKGISHLSEEMMVIRDINLAAYTDSKVHIHGVSSAKSVELIRRAKKEGIQVSCSVPALNVAFEDTALADFDPAFKVLPPLRENTDRMALHQGLEDGTIDMLISNHVPLEEEKKKLEFAYADFGAVGLETSYALLNTHVNLSLEKQVEILAISPRKIFQLPAVKIEEDQAADMTLFLPNEKWIVYKSQLASKSKNTPLEGDELKGKVIGIINGHQSLISKLR